MELPPEERFKRNLLSLFEIIEEMFIEGTNNNVINQSINILPLIKLYIKKTSSDHMIKRFITRTHDIWDVIKRKDDTYIKEKMLDIFNNIQEKGVDSVKNDEEFSGNKISQIAGALSGDHFVVFKDLLCKSYQFEGKEYYILDQERKNDIWKIMHSFVKISICYIHQIRKKVDGHYTVPFLNEIDISDLASEWKIKSI